MLAVLFFHGGFAWASGGYLGVSTFFTLSGFLITTMLVARHRRTGSIGGRDFLVRRGRRLFPAALAALALVVVFGLTVATADQQRQLFGDMVGALTATINWRFIVAGQSYAQLFTAPSPLQHFWSLAVEGQFYLVFPVVAAWALRRRTSTTRLAVAVGVGMAASLALTLFAGFGHDRIFYGTDTRAFELLCGAALALVVDRWSTGYVPKRARARRRPSMTVLSVGGTLALTACMVLWWRTSLDSTWVYRGGLPAYSLLSALIVATLVLAPGAMVTRALGTRPLRAIGAISYGLYVFHWPIFLWLTPARTHLALWPDFGLRLAVTTAVSVASFWLLEQPVLARRRPLPRPALASVALVVASVLVVASFGITTEASPSANDFAAAAAGLAHPTTDGASPAGRPSVGWFGDSTGLVLAEGTVFDAGGPVRLTNLGGDAELSCSVGQGGRRRLPDGEITTPGPSCPQQWDAYGDFVSTHHPDLAVVLYGPNDLYDRQVPGVCDDWCHIGTQPYDSWLQAQMLHIVDVLSQHGSLVVWLTTPPMAGLADRADTFNAMIRDLPNERPGKVVVADLGGYLLWTGKDHAYRPDGIHLSDKAAVVVGQGWLVPQLLNIWNDRAKIRAR